MTSKKLFTLEEANALVPQLLDWVPEIQKLSGSMNHDFPDIRNAREKRPSGMVVVQKELGYLNVMF